MKYELVDFLVEGGEVMGYRFKRWLRKLRYEWDIRRFKYPCTGCILLQTCQERCDKVDQAQVSYIRDRYPTMCPYCGGIIKRTGETEWFYDCQPPALGNIYRCKGCSYKYSVSGPGW